MKKVGYIGKVPVYEDPNVPPGMLYIMRDEFMEFGVTDVRSPRQRLAARLRHLVFSLRRWWKHEVERIKAGRETKWR